MTVALVGADGAGKSAVARQVVSRLGRPARYVYMGVNLDASDRMLPTTALARTIKRLRGRQQHGPPRRASTDRARHAQGRRLAGVLPATRTLLRTGAWLAEEWYRQLLVWRAERRGEIVVLDRHFLLDYYATDVLAPDRSLARRLHGEVLNRLYPKPDLVLFLDAPSEVLFARKPEGTLEAVEERRRDYLVAASVVPRFETVDAVRSLPVVVTDVVDRIDRFVDGRNGEA